MEIKGCIGDKAGRLGQLAILADRMSATTVLGGEKGGEGVVYFLHLEWRERGLAVDIGEHNRFISAPNQ